MIVCTYVCVRTVRMDYSHMMRYVVGATPGRLLKYNVVTTAIQHFVNKVRDEDRTEIDLCQPPLFCHDYYQSSRDFRAAICSQKYSPPCAALFWSNKYGLEINKYVWNIPRGCTKETRLRVLQWKILQNIYPTNIMLCKMKIRDNRKCSYCSNEIDYIEHFFFHCPIVKSFWKNVRQHIIITFDKKIEISVANVLLGITKADNIDKFTLLKINHILIIAKMCISIYKKTKSNLPLISIFENQLQLRKI